MDDIRQLVLAGHVARRRSDTRPRHLTDAEFLRLWRSDRDTRHPGAKELAVDGLTVTEQVEALESLWHRAAPR